MIGYATDYRSDDIGESMVEVVEEPPPDPTNRVSRATLASQVEEAVRVDIVTGALEPGRRLRASELSDRYGVSATPLREALQRLSARGLVELGPRLGATVAPLSIGELHDIYDLRAILEPLALEQAIELGDDRWVERVRQAYRRLEHAGEDSSSMSPAAMLDWSHIHRAFHDALLEACGSRWLLRFIDMLSDHSERYRMLSLRHPVRRSLQEHRAIFVAATSRDAQAATVALRQHLAATVAVLEGGAESTEQRD